MRGVQVLSRECPNGALSLKNRRWIYCLTVTEAVLKERGLQQEEERAPEEKKGEREAAEQV